MSSMGPLPLQRYANGGIANKPQIALFGEGRMNEAYVPLPDGRSIPVSMNMPRQSGGSVTTIAPVYQIDASGADPAAIARLEKALEKNNRALAAQGKAMESSMREQRTGVQ